MSRREDHARGTAFRGAALPATIVFVLCATGAQAQHRVVRTPARETPLTDVPYEAAGMRAFVSADGRSVACVVRRDAGEYVSHDGVLTGPFDEVAPRSLTLSYDGK